MAKSSRSRGRAPHQANEGLEALQDLTWEEVVEEEEGEGVDDCLQELHLAYNVYLRLAGAPQSMDWRQASRLRT